jgi:hypothetical protein
MSDILKSVIQDLINDRTEQATVSIHQYIVNKTQGLTGLTEATKDPKAVITAITALPIGDKPDAKIQAFLQKMCDRAEKLVLKKVLSDPDNYGLDYDIKAKDIRDESSAWATHVEVFENGFTIQVNLDLDNIGGDSRNHEQESFDVSGKPVADINGKYLAVLSAQFGFARDN